MLPTLLVHAVEIVRHRFAQVREQDRLHQNKHSWRVWLSLSILLGLSSGILSCFATPAERSLPPQGYVINGAVARYQPNMSIASAGDVNADGRIDIVFGEPSATLPGREYAGRVHVVFGKATASRIDLSSINNQGFIINEASAGDATGSSVASAGDINGDGRADLIIGARGASLPDRKNAGRVYVVFGKRGNTDPIDLNNLGSAGFIIDGIASGDATGSSVASAGDVNSDGIPDIIIGARSADPRSRDNAGRVYVVFGKRDNTDPIDLNHLGSGGFFIDGPNFNDAVGSSIASAGDVNSDGKADLIIGSHFASPQGRKNAGRAYVVFGKGSNDSIDLKRLGRGGFAIDGAAPGDSVGYSVASAGDIDADGKADIIIGARGADPQGRSDAGRAYVVFGKRSNNPIDLSNLSMQGFAIDGAAPGENAGYAVASIGDVNGDGRADLIVGASFADPQNRSNAGRAYVVFSKKGNKLVDLNSLGSGGFVINGDASGDTAGDFVANVGDVNGDSIPDCLVGASGADPQGRGNAGRVYIVFGKRGNTDPIELSNLIDLNDVDRQGFYIDGVTDSRTGSSVSSAGDINGDGISDLFIGSSYEDDNDVEEEDLQRIHSLNRSYVVFGKRNNIDSIDLNNLGTQGYIIIGAASSVTGAGDINGDSIPDLVVINPAGTAYVVFGKRGNTDSIDLANLGTQGYSITGAASSVSGVGDMNGDSIPDLIIGAENSSPHGRSGAGRAYVVFGKRGNTDPIDVRNLNTQGFVIDGAASGDIAGSSVASAGDVNSDGIPDFIIGASGVDHQGYSSAGRAYVVFGKRGNNDPIDLGNLGTQGFVINGARGDEAGNPVAGIGDINNDGIPDFIIGARARYAKPRNMENSSRAYVVFGKRGNNDPIDLNNLSTQGFGIHGDIDGGAGYSIAGLGDVNSDGKADLIVGVRGASPQSRKNAGRVYVVFGKATSNGVNLSNIGIQGFVMNGAASGDATGTSVASAGDINGDKIPDFIIGAPIASPQGRERAGRVYVIFGKRDNTDPIDLNGLGK
jgi:hypothetical protein